VNGFAEIPDEVRRLLASHERVALVLLDAFGLRFLERHDRHPFVRRLNVTPLQTQFPSTTTAHLSTIHFGLPVREHGLYEWNIWEPSLGRVIVPILSDDPAAFAPGPTFYSTLGVRSAVFSPDRISDSPFSRVTQAGAERIGFRGIEDGARRLAEAIAAPDGPRYAFLYWDVIDFTGHMEGPSSPAFAEQSVRALDALEAAFAGARDVLLLLTADHGQVDASPSRVDYVDELWPELAEHLTVAEPAGSARDLFLHVRDVDAVIAGLSEVLGERARVVPTAELFPDPGPRLAERLADVCVLPAPDRMAWLRSAAGVEQRFKGHHGGLADAETATYLASLQL
jgi:type I phosphodiesterase/nucleotide pyrophosphatase